MVASNRRRKRATIGFLVTKLLDTNVCIAILRGQAAARERLVAELGHEDLRLSAITAYELAFGAMNGPRPDEEMDKISRFIDGGPGVTDLNREDAEAAGRIRADLSARGQMIGAYDLLIGGQALARSWTLVTANTREFTRITGLRLEDWSR